MIDPQMMQRLSTMDSKRLALLALDLHERLQQHDDARHEPIAIVGMACRLPQSPDIEAFWRLLSEGRSATTEIPADRWDVDRHYSPDPDAPGKMVTRHGHFIEQPQWFDAAFFGISAREARSLDPQQRLLLETSWRALEDAMLPPPTLAGRQVGVFMGIATTDYLQHGTHHVPLTDSDAYMGTGCAASVAAGRVSYVLGLAGPSLPVDTACSSSLVAVHLACQSLRSGESEMALAGGVNAMLLPDTFVYFSRLKALSPDGRCKTFDARADGYGRGEGCGVVVLKRLSDALRDGNEVVAVIRGSAVNHDGRSNGLTVPSGLAQEAVVRAALRAARVEARQVAYVEAHGTGTPLGDPIELHALGAVHRGREVPLQVGSAKTNIGHLEAAAGIAGLIKLALMLRHRRIAPHLHLQQRNPYIDWENIPLTPVTEGRALDAIDGRRIAGVSSFGFSGTNAHVILESFDAAPATQASTAPQRPLSVMGLSARTPAALRQAAADMASRLEAGDLASRWADACWTANAGRAHFDHRLALQAASAAEAAALLRDWAAEDTASPQIAACRVGKQAAPAVAFLCSGQGAQAAGMGRALFDSEPVFRATIEASEQALAGLIDVPLTDLLWGTASDRLDRTQYTQPALFAVEVALGRMWLSWGIVPRLLLGHSVGEFAAACLAGVFSLEDGLRLTAARGRLMHERCEPGAMLALACDEAAARRLIAPHDGAVSVAAVNGPHSVVLAGPAPLIDRLQAETSALRPRRLEVSHAFHSAMMEPMLAAFAACVATVDLKPPRWTLVSNLSGRAVDPAEITRPDYWVRHVREAVRFGDSVAAAVALGATHFIEIGPRPVLLGMARAAQTEERLRWLPSLQPPVADDARVAETLRQLHLGGVAVDWAARDAGQVRRKVALPSYPFERQRFWIDARERADAMPGAATSDPTLVTPTIAEVEPGPGPQPEVPQGLARWFYRVQWVDAPPPGPALVRDGPWLLLADAGGAVDGLAALLRAQGRAVVTVQAGTAWSRPASDRFTLRPAEGTDLTRLLDELGAVPAVIVHGWGLDAPADADPMAAQGRGYASALALLKATMARGLRTPPRLHLLTRDAQPVLDGDAVAGFAQAPLWSLARVASLEFPALRCQVLDLDGAVPSVDQVDWLAQAVTADDGELFLAHRGERTLAARLARLPAVADATPAQPEGAWLVTGGLGGIGLEVAQWLVDAGVRRLALVGRSAPSEAAQARLAAWRGQGATVETIAADITDADACERAVVTARAAIGPLTGVMHCAGVMRQAPLLDTDWAMCETVLAPKLAGTWHLHRSTLADPLQHFVGFSSMSAVLGSPGHAAYAPANAALDAVLAHRRASGRPALGLNWGPWAATGMAAALTGETRTRWDALGIYGSLDAPQAVQALGLAMGADAAQLMVISTDWERFFQVFPLGLEPPFLAAMTAEARRRREPSPAWRALQSRLAAMGTPDARHALLVDWLERELAAVLGAPKDTAFDPTQGFFDLGMDSLMSVEFRTRLQVAVGSALALPMTLTFDHPNLAALATFFERHARALAEAESPPALKTATVTTATAPVAAVTAAPTAPAAPAAARAPGVEPIAIIGIGCRFPGGADDPATFWRHLSEGHDAIGEVPASRWAIDDYHDPDPDAPGKMVTRFGGFVDGLESFDAAFFGVSPREAARLDPQQRMLMETSWRALEDAALAPTALRGRSAGVFVGVSVNDYPQLLARHGGADQIDAYMGVGNALSMVAGRLAHFLGLQGPVMSIDTACSSSLVALHLACENLHQGNCEVALAGGVNAILVPEVNIGLSKARMLAPDGRCKTFDAAADGYVRSEGCGIVVLKRLSDAQRDGDRIVAVVRATAMNHDGRSSGLTVPNAEAQVALLQTCLDRAGLAAADIDYVETHGTGTPLGDPIEVQALARVLGEGRGPDRPLLIGAAKTNVGHLESAAGSVGLIKSALSLMHGEIPATLHQHKPNPYIPWHELPLQVVARHRPWPRSTAPRRAGVSSFGFSGTNAHVILEQAPERVGTGAAAPAQAERPVQLLVLSAKSRAALEALAQATQQQLRHTTPAVLPDLCHVLARGRAALPYRLAVAASSPQALADALPQALQAAADARSQRQRVAFLFTGQGSQQAGMGHGLYRSEPVFRDAIDRCEAELSTHLDVPLTALLWGDHTGLLGQTQYTQPALFALEYALGSLWASWGVTPQFALGHSVGEYAAACLAGVFSLQDGLRLIAARGRLMHQRCPPGAMAALECDADRARTLIAPWSDTLALAALNGPRNTVVAGEPEALAALLRELPAQQVRAHRLEVSRAFHSPLMDPMLDAFRAEAATVTYHAPRWAIVSNLLGRLAEPHEMACADYWVDHARAPVLFEAGVSALAALGANTFVELGPQPVLSAMARHVVEGSSLHWLPSLRPGHDDARQLHETLGALFVGGAEIDWRAYAAPWPRRPVAAPVYPFERQRFWPEGPVQPAAASAPAATAAASATAAPVPAGHPLLGRAIRSPAIKGALHEAAFSAFRPSYLDDHRIYSMIVVPGASHMAMVATAVAEAEPGSAISITQVAFEEVLVVPDDEPRTVQLMLEPAVDGKRAFEIHSQAGEAEPWLLHALGRVATQRPGSGRPAPATPDVAALKARLSDEIPSSRPFYQLLSRQGIQLGRQFRWVDRLWRADGEVLGQLRLPADFDSADDYFVHPGLLDSCFQMMGAALHSKDLEAGALIPIAIEELRFFRRPAGALFEHVRMRPADAARPDLRVADLLVFDDQGQPVVEVTGLRIHRAPRTALTRFSQRRLHDAVHGLRWTERPLPASTGASLGGQHWLLLDDRGGFTARLDARLAAAGARVLHATLVDADTPARDGALPVDLSDEHGFDHLLRTLREARATPQGIVFASTLDGVAEDAAAIDGAQRRGALALMRLAQALGRVRSGAAPRLMVLTRCADAADDSSPVDLSHATVVGLARVIANEMPDLTCQRLDLGPASDDEQATDAVLHELLARADEDRVALRAGQRLVQRLGRSLPGTRGSEFAFSAGEPYQLVRSAHGVLEDITLQAAERQPPGPGEVEILVEATGLNFRDVLNALGLYPGDAGPMGGECAGTVVGVGDGVTGVQVGERVLAIGAGTFNRYTLTDARMVRPLPAGLSPAQAATIPVTYVTAWLGLVEMAALKAGESVLVHAGAGGVGMAAIRLAQHLGAVVHATAGSERKREHLRAMGVQHLYDSRSLDFADGVRAATGGRGVDVVLNSLAGDFIPRSLEITAPGGRFVEIGKNQIWTPEQVRAVRPDLGYWCMALDEVITGQPGEVGRMLGEVLARVADGTLQALPHDGFQIAQVVDALRHLAQARHIGKVVVLHGDEAAAQAERPLLQPGGEVLVTGGLGGIGLALARWLATQGAQAIRLVGRSAPSAAAEAVIEQLRAAGTTVTVSACDVAQRAPLAALLADMRQRHGRVAAVFHAAGALDDAPLMMLDEARWRTAVDAKWLGALHLDALTRDDALDAFVLFSSAAGVLGTPGQANYAAANAALDALAQHRRRAGRPALSIDWGPWADAGMAARTGAAVQRMWAAMGIAAITERAGLGTLEMLLRQGPPQAVVVHADWPRVARASPTGSTPPLLQELAGDDGAQAAASAEWLAFVERLKSVTAGERKPLMVAHFRAQVARVLGLKSADDIDARTPLVDLGLDSLMAVELANQLRASTGAKLRVTQLFDHPTIDALAEHFLTDVLGLHDREADARPTAAPAPLRSEELISSIADISDDEVERRLRQLQGDGG